MHTLYTIGIYLFTLAARVLSLFNRKARRAVNGRDKTFKYLSKKLAENKGEWIWIHCSSLGEFEQGRPILEALKRDYPNHKIALSFFSPSGYEVRKNYPLADAVFYIPWDTPLNAKKLSNLFNPKLWILVKYDYWYNHLAEFYKKGVPIVVISSIFRASQIYFQPYGTWFAKKLSTYIHHFFVQDKNSKKRLEKIHIENVTVAGDTRFDRVSALAQSGETLSWLKKFKNHHKLIVVGSSWKEDEDLWVKWINQHLPQDWKVLIAPHQISEKGIIRLKSIIKPNTILYSKAENLAEAKVIILDTIGLLSKAYAEASIAYVGGGFNKSGVHNTLEPSVFGIPVIIGPNYRKFNEVIELKSAHALFSIENYEDFETTIHHLIKSDLTPFIGHTRKVFSKNLGATQKILKELKPLLCGD